MRESYDAKQNLLGCSRKAFELRFLNFANFVKNCHKSVKFKEENVST